MSIGDVLDAIAYIVFGVVLIASIGFAVATSICNKLDKYQEYCKKCRELDEKLQEAESGINNIKDIVNRQIEQITNKVLEKNYFSNSIVASAFAVEKEFFDCKRMNDIIYADMKILPSINIEATILSNGRRYTTTFNSCTCPDFVIRKKPCKHMIRLAYELGIIFGADRRELFKKNISELDEERLQLDIKNKDIQKSYRELDRQKANFDKAKQNFLSIDKQKLKSIPWLAQFIADYVYYNIDLPEQKKLLIKSNPAIKAADKVSEISKEKRILIAENKVLQYQMAQYEALFPQLSEYKEVSADDLKELSAPSDSDNGLRKWLSEDEYRNLSLSQKLSRSLERYMHRKKSNWEVGIDYERYIGYTYEKQGYKVKYTGALQGLQDMGRDIIAKKDNTILVIQCKRWSADKTIHEKHIFQLYGSVILMQIQNQSNNVKGVFVTTTSLSELAHECAKKLNIEIIDNMPLGDYPLIKCNINKVTGEHIYHLPFDQQYDSIEINNSKGEFFASTIEEAESAGFRHALRHLPS